MNVGSFVTSEKETFGIFSDGYAQSVTDEFIFEYNSLRDVLEKDSLSLMYENALGTSKLKHSKIQFLPHLLIQLKLYV